MTASLTYVYCLLRSPRRPELANLPPGMPGAEGVRAFGAGGGLWLVVSDVPAGDYDEAAIAQGLQSMDWVGRRAMAHEAVVECFLDARALLPMQLFTLFTADDRALAYVARHRDELAAVMARVERQLEWGLRLTFDEKGAREAVEMKHSMARPGKGRAALSGSAYLTRKRDLLDVARVQLTEAAADSDRLYRAMSREATEARRRSVTEQAPSGSRLLLDAAFLVPIRRSDAFRAALRRNTRKLGAAGIVATLTGPWPPYNFIEAPAREPRRRRTPSPPGGRTRQRDRRTAKKR